jgi:hypothetical protein
VTEDILFFERLFANESDLADGSEVDCSFFLVTVDLWSADGKHEMNLVLHPSSTDRYVPSHASKSKRKGMSVNSLPIGAFSNAITTAATGGGGRTTPTPSHYRPGDQVRKTPIA